MKKFLFCFISVFFCVSALTQEVDTSLISNISSDQIELIKSQINESNTGNIQSDEVQVLTDNEETLNKRSSINTKIYGNKYGYSYFNSIPTSLLATGDLPLPNDYKISLNDQITVILSGAKESIFDLNVKLNGTILFPELGSISVAGETFNDVKVKLRNLIRQSYVGVDIDISLKNLSAKKITIVGAVNTPGTYLVNPFTTISSAMAYSGGISPIGTMRNIKLLRANGEVFTFDLYDLLIFGDRSGDITIEAGDVILIDPAYQFVTIDGQVKRPAIYEVKPDETINDLVSYALGFNFPNFNKILLTKIDPAKNQIELTNATDLKTNLKNVLSIDIFGFNNSEVSSVSVQGAVKEPGYYEIKNNETLLSMLDRLEFVDVYPWLAVLEQFDKDNLTKSSILFNLNDRSTYENIKVLPGAKLFFADINTRLFSGLNNHSQRLIDDYSLTISHKQGVYVVPVYGKYKVSSFVDLIGLDMSDVDPIARYTSPLNSVVFSQNYNDMEFIAQKYNRVQFRSPVNDLITVSIGGAIDYPGNYTLQSNSTLSDLYKLIGNFKNEAFLEGIIFSRVSVRERQLESIKRSKQALNESLLVSAQKGDNIGNAAVIESLFNEIEPNNLGRIAGDFSPNSINSINTILFNGDSIFIPKNPNVINVFGEVLNPISFEYSKNISINEAVNNAGGYKEYANKSRVYVIKSNGLTERASRNIFVKNVKLEPGDTIVVPRKIITNNPGVQALIPITQILSDMAFSAAAIESLSNN